MHGKSFQTLNIFCQLLCSHQLFYISAVLLLEAVFFSTAEYKRHFEQCFCHSQVYFLSFVLVLSGPLSQEHT